MKRYPLDPAIRTETTSPYTAITRSQRRSCEEGSDILPDIYMLAEINGRKVELTTTGINDCTPLVAVSANSSKS